MFHLLFWNVNVNFVIYVEFGTVTYWSCCLHDTTWLDSLGLMGMANLWSEYNFVSLFLLSRFSVLWHFFLLSRLNVLWHFFSYLDLICFDIFFSYLGLMCFDTFLLSLFSYISIKKKQRLMQSNSQFLSS